MNESKAPAPSSETDLELAQLPEPRRPWRRATFAAMALVSVISLGLSLNLVPDLVYALNPSPPVEVNGLEHFRPGPELHNRLVHGEGTLSPDRAIRYERPMEPDSYRLAEVVGNPNLWVEVRVPEGEEGPRFVPPTSFVGRLVRADAVSIRQKGLVEAVADAGLGELGRDTWILIDGEAPQSLRWVFGLLGLLLAFAIFNVVGILRLARPIRSRRAVRATT
jgi:hypothetical protein